MASGPPGYLRAWFEHYDDLSRDSAARWTAALQKIKGGTYKPDDLTSDVAYFWTEAIRGVWLPWLVNDPGVVPSFAVDLAKADASHTDDFPVALDPATVFVKHDLVKVGGAKKITAAQQDYKLVDGGAKLEVVLDSTGVNLQTDEIYKGNLDDDQGRTLAIIVCTVVQ